VLSDRENSIQIDIDPICKFNNSEDRIPMATTLPPELERLSVEERIALAVALWDSIADQPRPPLSEAKRAELKRRALEAEKNPDDVVTWEEFETELKQRWGKS
jgi:putative addiction module component (TIGR02574 family)